MDLFASAELSEGVQAVVPVDKVGLLYYRGEHHSATSCRVDTPMMCPPNLFDRTFIRL